MLRLVGAPHPSNYRWLKFNDSQSPGKAGCVRTCAIAKTPAIAPIESSATNARAQPACVRCRCATANPLVNGWRRSKLIRTFGTALDIQAGAKYTKRRTRQEQPGFFGQGAMSRNQRSRET